MARSSANRAITKSSNEIAESKSFIYNKNNKGPKIVPCGTPRIDSNNSDEKSLKLTYSSNNQLTIIHYKCRDKPIVRFQITFDMILILKYNIIHNNNMPS